MTDGVQMTGAGTSIDIDIDRPTKLDAPSSVTSTDTPGAAATGATPDVKTVDATNVNKAWLETVPQEYATKEWVTRLAVHENPTAEMFKQLDNQISLIGRKAEGLKVPEKDAKPEDWQAFNKAIGVPESPDQYEYTPPEVKEELKQFYNQDDKMLSLMKEACMKGGVRADAFPEIAKVFDNYFIGELDKAVTANNQLFEKLENNFKTKFGDKSSQVIEGWKQSFANSGSEATAVIEALDPRVKVVLAEHYNDFARKYINEDKLSLDVPTSGAGMTEAEYGDEYARLFSETRHTKPGSPEHLVATQKLKSLKERGASQIFKK